MVIFMKQNEFGIPDFDYFRMGGVYSGSVRGTERDDFNFRMSAKDGTLGAAIWYGLNCIELSEPVAKEDFESDREGYSAALKWIEERRVQWESAHKPLSPSIGSFYKPQ